VGRALKAIMNANGFDVTEDPNGIIYVDTFEQIAARQATVPLTHAHRSLELRQVEQRRADDCAAPLA
jgi:ATP-dependent protease Clp ATPase subunit